MLNSNKKRTGVLLVNLGTPDSYKVSDVRKYLIQFLNDPRVIDISALGRFLLVNFIIAPFRSPKSAKIYKEVWTDKGSPLLIYGEQLTKKVQNKLGDNYKVVLGMRYQNPSLESAVNQLWDCGIDKILLFPMFPQYASASTGSVIEEFNRIIAKKQIFPNIKIVSNFFDHPLFIKAFVELAQGYLQKQSYDHILFSYHGLPERQIKKGDCTGTCLVNSDCCSTIHSMNYFCYRAQCYETTRLIAKQLNLNPVDYTTSFQSRLGNDPWIKPYTDFEIKRLVKEGKKRVLVLVPSFVADCLETIVEVGREYEEIFKDVGGEHWQMVPSLNTSDTWVDMIEDVVKN
ncbi:MAG: ferrochelatase [Bacteroidota bacterium]|nr:ferrochelatase [Bacteroidota bacterium]